MRDFFRSAGRAVASLYPRGASMLWLAPAVLALVVIPEFAQHVVEIRIGMFESAEAARSLQNEPTRWAFGYIKIAGLVLTFLAAARFWWTREHGGRWWDVRDLAWSRLALGALIVFGVGSLPELLRGTLDERTVTILGAVWMLLTLPGLFILLAGLFGDRATPIAAMWRRGWPWLLLTAVLLVLAFAPASWLHGMNHRWAMGAAPAVLLGLMIWDSLLVGLLAGLVGTALHLGYAGFAAHQRKPGAE
jgi:hypothetical protein